MTSLRTTFGNAAFGTFGSDTFWLLIWIIFILDDARRDEKERRKKRERAAALARAPKPPAGPRPC
jgi:succinate-acetate transporter protein